MPATFQGSAATGLWAEMQLGSKLDFTLDFTNALDPGDTIASVSWTADAGLTLTSPTFTGARATAWLQGGAANTWYAVRAAVTTAAGRIHVQSFRIRITEPAAFQSAYASVFPSLTAAVSDLRRDRLMTMAAGLRPNAGVTDDYLLEKLVSAEATVARALRVFLTPREVIPQEAPQAEEDALVTSGATVVREPAYDYAPNSWRDDHWGLIELRQRPVSAVRRVTFAYPAPGQTLWEVPAEWIRLEGKTGRVQFVPTQSSNLMPLNTMLLSWVSGGRQIPMALQVRYRCGIENAARDWPDILSVIKQSAVAQTIEDRFLPQSGSTSADGLSQSMSWDVDKYREVIEGKLKRLRQALNGIAISVF